MILQTAIDSYREEFLKYLYSRKAPTSIEILTGSNHFQASVKTRITLPYRLHKNIFFLNRRVLFHSGAIKNAIKGKVLVAEMNPRIISNWLIIFIRRIKGRPIYLWGHHNSRSYASSKRVNLRRLMTRAGGNRVIAYTEHDASLFAEKWGIDKIILAPNSLYLKEDIRNMSSASSFDFVVSGRVSEEKDPELIIRGFLGAQSALKAGTKLHFIGDGELIQYCKILSAELDLNESVIFHGFNSDREFILNIHSKCCASVSAGFVGLNVIQSLGFGIPLVYSKNPKIPHSPEAYLLNDGNSLSYPNNHLALSYALIQIQNSREFWHQKSSEISEKLRNVHNIEEMAKGFVDELQE